MMAEVRLTGMIDVEQEGHVTVDVHCHGIEGS